MKKKTHILSGILILTMVLTIFSPIIENEQNITNTQTIKYSVDSLKTSEWKSGFNYSIIDNYPYSWIEINETGTEFKGWVFGNSDDGVNFTSFNGQGWNFTFYGTEYNYLNISTNAWMTFTKDNDPTPYNWMDEEAYNFDPIPQNGSDIVGKHYNHNDTVCLLATDLDLGVNGQIFYQFFEAAPNRYLVIEYFNVAERATGDNQTLEAIFYENGDIKFQYKTITDPWISNTNYWDFQDAKAGLDHGDLIHYSNYTNNWNKTFDSSAVQELAVYFRLTKGAPIYLPSGDDDDDDGGEVAIPGYDLFLILLAPLLAVILIAKKLKKQNN